MKRTKRKTTAVATCSGFDIEIVALVKTKGLDADESQQVNRALKDKLTKTISTLPFAHTYPFEVVIR